MFNVLDKQTFSALSNSNVNTNNGLNTDVGPFTVNDCNMYGNEWKNFKVGDSKPSAKSNFHQKRIQLKNIVGTKVRSKNGCLNCKRRKKKCDEVYPVCSSCKHRNQVCTWNGKDSKRDGKMVENNDNATTVIKNQQSFTTPLPPYWSPSPSYLLDPQVGMSLVNNLVKLEDNSGHSNAENDNSNQAITYVEAPDLFKDSQFAQQYPWKQYYGPESMMYVNGRTPPLLDDPLDDLLWSPVIHPIIPMITGLDNTGKLFLNHFLVRVTKIVTVATEKKNHLIETYGKFVEEPAIAHALAAWGGYYLRGTLQDSQVQYHMNQSLVLINKFISSRTTFDRFDNYKLLCFCMCILAIRVCTGDTFAWKVMHDNARIIIENLGGIEKLCNDFGRSNEIKFLLSSFQYHDVMSSTCSLKGTAFPISHYRTIFDDNYLGEYGVDTLQGCNQQAYLILGELMSIKAQTHRNEAHLQELIQQGDVEQYESFKIASLRYAKDKIDEIEPLILALQPNNVQLECAESERGLHQTMCEIYVSICHLYASMYIKRIPPKSYGIQMLLLDAVSKIDQLMDSRMNIILCFPLLMCGISSIGKLDRDRMEARFLRLVTTPIDNITKALDITKEAWRLNPHGDLIIDWSDICREFNWEFSPC